MKAPASASVLGLDGYIFHFSCHHWKRDLDFRFKRGILHFPTKRENQVKSSCYSPNFIEQTAHCDHKPRAAWVCVRLLLHRRSAAGWAECMIYSALVSFFLVPVFCWKAEGDVSPGFGAGVAGLGFVLPRGPGSGEGAVAHKGSPPLLSGVELGGWSRGAWLLAPWARWRRRRVGGVGGRWAIDDLGQYVAGVLWRGVHCPSRLGPAEDPPLVTVYAARSRHLVNVEGTPAARRALLSVRPHVIWGPNPRPSTKIVVYICKISLFFVLIFTGRALKSDRWSLA